MASSKEKRSQRHQSQPKQNVTQANPRTKVTEQVAGSGYRETQFIGGKNITLLFLQIQILQFLVLVLFLQV